MNDKSEDDKSNLHLVFFRFNHTETRPEIDFRHLFFSLRNVRAMVYLSGAPSTLETSP
jgi:hypothetical protein